ncbi:hypothetical protein GBO14_03445 [Pseudoalteromonas shioyasakiensis]|uniref:hypothetical protein n=1 Tax=Pseudoalteromonas shioyasakiensis TaxID=1190813 RepID=UPI0020949AD4|nr:hypothetical protein [Pseudoalteromonas shioyasakiensis]MCO6353820.1 hypothetical protein [Pseudoalteromonas shioyasakiensis]
MHVKLKFTLILSLSLLSIGCVKAEQCAESMQLGETTLYSKCRGAEAISSSTIHSSMSLDEAFEMMLDILESKGDIQVSKNDLYVSIFSIMQTEQFNFRVTSFPNGILLASENTSAIYLKIDEKTWLQKVL